MNNKSIRIRTTPGLDKNIQIKMEQNFDVLEILSLKINQEDLYNTFCADYGVLVGRVIANKGFGVPNAKVSVFVPITSDDEKNQLISDLYPYKTSTSKNKDSVRYNLLLSEAPCDLNKAVGTFPTKEELLNNDIMIEVYEKYYKYTTKTNESGDYLIFGVPTGQQTVHMDVDLSDVGIFSIRPYDLIDSGYPVELFDGRKEFKESINLDALPQIKSGNKGVNVLPFWGDDEKCQLGITRVDFDTNFEFKPTSIMIGSIFTDSGKNSLNKNCKPRNDQGNHEFLRTGSGTLEAIRVDEYTYEGDGAERKIKPLSLEKYVLPQGIDSIDKDGAFAVTVPMNLDHVITDEEGNLIPSNDPDIGVATNGMYRFKVKFNDSSGAPKRRTGQVIFPSLNRNTGGSKIELSGPQNSTENARWSDNIDVWRVGGVFKEDNIYKDFHNFEFNQIYTISQYITKYKKGLNRFSFLGLKNGDSSTFNPMPFTTIVKRFDIIYGILKIVINLQASLMKMLIFLSSLTFTFCLFLGFRFSVLRANINIKILNVSANVRPFSFLKNVVPSGGLTLDCESDASFPYTINDWGCKPSGVSCDCNFVCFKFLVKAPGDSDGGGSVVQTYKCNKYIAVDKWLCCTLYDLAVSRGVIRYVFTDSWLNGTFYMPQFKFKNDKYCGPGTKNKGGDKYRKQKCANRGGGGFNDDEKAVIRGYKISDDGSTYHKNNYLTGAKDIGDFIYTPENYPTKIINLGRTDSCPDVIDRVNRCIKAEECLIDLFKTSPCRRVGPSGVRGNCLMGTYYSEGTDTRQWVDGIENTTYQNPSQVVLELISDCKQGPENLFSSSNCAPLKNKCESCEVDKGKAIIRTISRIYADIVLTDEVQDNTFVYWEGFLNNMSEVEKFSKSVYREGEDPLTNMNNDKLGDGYNHLGDVPYFYFGLVAGSTSLDKLRSLFIVEKK